MVTVRHHHMIASTLRQHQDTTTTTNTTTTTTMKTVQTLKTLVFHDILKLAKVNVWQGFSGLEKHVFNNFPEYTMLNIPAQSKKVHSFQCTCIMVWETSTGSRGSAVSAPLKQKPFTFNKQMSKCTYTTTTTTTTTDYDYYYYHHQYLHHHYYSSSSSTTVGSMPVGVWRHSYYRCPPLPI